MSQLSLVSAPVPRVPDLIDLRCCDVAEMLASLPDGAADMVIADPPWNYGDAPPSSAYNHYKCLQLDEIAGHVQATYRIGQPNSYLAVWYTFPFARDWFLASTELSWRYLSGGAWAKVGLVGTGFHWRGNAEAIGLYGKGKPRPVSTDVLVSCHVTQRYTTNGGNPTRHSQKPVEWQRDMIRSWCPPGGLVLDLYAGLGSVAEAVLLAGEGRRYVGAEIDPQRHRDALALIAQVRPC